MSTPLLDVRDLGVWARRTELVRHLGLTVGRGERVGLVGESGSGKSVTALAIAGLLPDQLYATGNVGLDGGPRPNLLDASERELARVHGAEIGMVFQEPLSALNPLRRAGDQVAETLRIHGWGGWRERRTTAYTRALELLGDVGLPDPPDTARSFPHQLSGGQRQRVLIASALATDPKLLICDEPTSALDVTVQARILDLLVEAAAERDAGLLLITHDLAVASERCDRVVVLRDGSVVESGPTGKVLGAPTELYTCELVASVEVTGQATGRPTPATGGEPLMAASNLCRTFRRARRSLRHRGPEIAALREVDLRIHAGERFGVVGESGSGKSTLIRLLAGLDQPTSGSLRYDGREIAGLPERRLRFLREDMQLVFQDPAGSLDPRMRVGDIIAEPLRALGRRTPGTPGTPSTGTADIFTGPVSTATRVAELLRAVDLPAEAAERYPHQFSGGQRQRISIARALAPDPRLLIADEPVSALDASVRAQILDLLTRIADDRDLTLLFVSHDLTVVRHVCDRVVVLREGKIVESGPVEQVYAAPQHPYTQALLAAVPTLDRH